MKTLNKFILLSVIVFMFIPKAYSQNNADPGIAIIVSPPSVTLGSTGVLSATVGNYGNQTIALNSLRLTISVGTDAEIIGIAAGSDARWGQLTLTAGSGNTISLTNSAGGFNAFDVGDVLLTVEGNVVSTPDVIVGNIVYVTAQNPLLCGGCSPAPLNPSQGNASPTNDNSSTSLVVTTDVGAMIITGTVFYDYTRLFDNTVNGLPNIPANMQAVLVKVEAGHDDEVIAVVALPTTSSAFAGQYQFDGVSGTTYYVMLTTTSPLVVVGGLPPAASSLASGYFSTGESLGLIGSDSVVDGKVDPFIATSSNFIDVNFGIIRFLSTTVD